MQESNVIKVKSEVAIEVMRLLAGNGAMPMSAESDSDIELRSRSKRSVGGE